MKMISLPKETLERMLAEALADQRDWETRGVESMSNWHEGRASMAKLILDVWGN